MQSPASPQPRPSQALAISLIIILLVTTVAGLGAAFIFYQQDAAAQTTNTSLSNQISSLTAQVSNLNAQLNSMNLNVHDLQNQLNALKANVINVTDVDGNATAQAGTAVAIVFRSATPGIRDSSSIIYRDGTYAVEVQNGISYSVIIEYVVTNSITGNGIYTCTPFPSTFSVPSGPSGSARQNFGCMGA